MPPLSDSFPTEMTPKDWVEDLATDPRLASSVQSYFKDNKTVLLEIGKDVFIQFVYLLQQGKKEEAMNLLIESANFDQLAEIMGDIAAAEKRANDMRELRKKVAIAFVSTVGLTVGKIILGILVKSVLPI